MSTIDTEACRKKHPTLPIKPEGWTQNLVVHLNFGRGHGAATYRISDPDGTAMPLTRFYNTKEQRRGYHIDGDETDYATWSHLRDAWAASAIAKAEGQVSA